MRFNGVDLNDLLDRLSREQHQLLESYGCYSEEEKRQYLYTVLAKNSKLPGRNFWVSCCFICFSIWLFTYSLTSEGFVEALLHTVVLTVSSMLSVYLYFLIRAEQRKSRCLAVNM